MDRIMIVGAPGSGKSTLARALGGRTGLPVIHMDHIHWEAGWIERPRAERAVIIAAHEAAPRWIIEGNFRATTAARAGRADLVVWLDLPLPLRLWRVLRRQWTYRGRGRPDLPAGCEERLSLLPGFLLYMLRTRGPYRRELEGTLGPAAGGKLVRLRSARAVRTFLDGVRP